MSSNLPLGGHGSTDRRIRNVRHEDGRSPVPPHHHVRSHNRLQHAQHDRSSDIFHALIPVRHHRRPDGDIQKTPEQEHAGVHDAGAAVCTHNSGHR